MRNANSQALNGRPLDRDVAAAIGREVRVTNDANCLAMSEAADGAGAGYRTVFAVIIGTGCGGGIVSSGPHPGRAQPHRRRMGPHAAALDDGRRIPRPALLVRAAWVPRDLPVRPRPRGRLRRAGRARRRVDPGPRRGGRGRAAAALARHADRLARALGMIANILDPDVIVLGGGLSNMQHLYREVPPLMARHVLGDVARTPLVQARHGDSSGVFGAARLWDGA